jgi:flagellar hook-length control protein FliK
MMMLPTIQTVNAPGAAAMPQNTAAQDTPAASNFAHCLDQAREREPPPSDEAPQAEEKADQPHVLAKKPSRARAVALPEPARGQPAAADAKPVPQAESEATDGKTAGDNSETTQAKAPSPDIAALLPGWPPAREASVVAAKAADTAPAVAMLRSSAHPPPEATPSTPTEMPAATPAQPATNAAAFAPDAAPAARTPTPRVRDLEPAFVVSAPVTHAAAPSASAAPVATAHVNAPLDTPAFAPALATQVRWLVQDGVQQAQLTLNPPEMGPVAVQIVIDGRDARIDFTADFAATRTAIEASLPVLAAALDESGLKLSGGGVHDGSRSQHGHGGSGARGGSQRNDTATTARSERAVQESAARGLVDLVA